jgi:hypothetical protein
MNDLEKEIEKIIEEYGAPKNITEDIKEFLIRTGHLYAIIEIAKLYPT